MDDLRKANEEGVVIGLKGAAGVVPRMEINIWQDVYPKKWFDGNDSAPMLEKPLLPFFSPKGQDKEGFWTSLSARKTEAFGYTYSDVKGDSQTTKDNFRRLYSWSVRPQPEPKDWKPTPPPQMEPLDLSEAQVFKNHPEYVAPTPPVHIARQAKTNTVPNVEVVPQPMNMVRLKQNPTPTAKYREWFVDDTVERLALNGAFSIDYFIGPKGGAIDVKPNDWGVAPTLAGSTYIFSAPTDLCDNCGVQKEQAYLVTDTTSLTGMLMDYIKIGELASIEPEDVKPFLIDRLRWRVRTVNGDVIDPRKLAGFKVSVSSKVSSAPWVTHDEEVPIIEDYPKITEEIIRRASAQAEHASQ